MSDRRREEAEEASAWALGEVSRLRAETQRLQTVVDAARVVAAKGGESDFVCDLREALFEQEVAKWKTTAPANLLEHPAWLSTRPWQNGEGDTGTRRVRSWVEAYSACVTDGHAVLVVHGATVAERRRPPDWGAKGPAEHQMAQIDWHAGHAIQYEALVAARDSARSLGANLTFAGDSAVLIDPILIEHFIPRWSDRKVYVSLRGPLDAVGFHGRGPIGGIAHGYVWYAIIMPVRGGDGLSASALVPLGEP